MSSNRSTLIGVASATVTAAVSYMLYQSISQYGVEGTIRYIWVGDPYHALQRQYLTILKKGAQARIKEEKRLNEIEEALDRARLDSIDDHTRKETTTTREIVKAWIENYPSLEKSLAQTSQTLDRLAAQVDGVLLSKTDPNSKISQEIKREKKLLSKQLVLDMERCDALICSFSVLQEQ